jgi:hypothetical protein
VQLQPLCAIAPAQPTATVTMAATGSARGLWSAARCAAPRVRILPVAALLAAAAVSGAHAATSGTVYYNATAKGFYFVAGTVDPVAGVATGSYARWTESPSAFGSLSITTNAAFGDAQQAAAAGFLEGALTQADIFAHWTNVYAWLLSNFPGRDSLPPQFEAFFVAQDAWARANAASNTTSPFWQATSLVLAQLDGLMAGYNASAPLAQALSAFQLQSLNAVGDYLDLISALTPQFAPDWENMSPRDVARAFRTRNHCSGLVKVTGNYSELFFAHSSWFIFQSTLRIYKHYNFNFANAAAVGRQVSFSSYPAYLSSLDDFYEIWSTGLAVIETSNSIFNMSLYQYVHPQSLFAWQRVRVANLLSTSGGQWSSTFATYNSGSKCAHLPLPCWPLAHRHTCGATRRQQRHHLTSHMLLSSRPTRPHTHDAAPFGCQRTTTSTWSSTWGRSRPARRCCLTRCGSLSRSPASSSAAT